MTDLIGPKPEPTGGYRLTPNRINIVYPTRRKAEAALATLQAHSHPDYEYSEVVEDTAPGPRCPTPWRADKSTGTVYDAGGNIVADVLFTSTTDVFPELAAAIVEAVNAYYGGSQPIDLGSKREPRVFDGSEEPPADVKKLLAQNGALLERHPGGGWHWTMNRFGGYIGIDDEESGWKWRADLIESSYLPLTEILD